MTNPKRVLFLCTANSARSQMAEGLMRSLGSGKWDVQSGGTFPSFVHPLAVQVMKEIGIDISDAKPKMLTFEMMDSADRVITMGCLGSDVCPATMAPTEDWGIEDPADKSIEKFRQIRDTIKGKVEKLVQDLEKNKA
jgi:protein-tyrosine-phosphatase